MKLLLGIDDSRYSLGAVRFLAQYLAGREGTRVELIHVVPRAVVLPGRSPPRHSPEVRRIPSQVRALLDRAAVLLRRRGFIVEGHVRRGVPARVVPEFADENRYDLVVVGAKGRSDTPFLETGSVAHAVLEHTPSNVLMMREREARRRRQPGASGEHTFPVLFAADGSAYSRAAARCFFRLFNMPHLRATAIAVADLPEPPVLRRMPTERRKEHVAHVEEASHHWLRKMQTQLESHHAQPKTRALRGRPAKTLVDAADKSDAGLIVLGSRGLRGTWEPRLGSVALGVARASPCSVLVVRSDSLAASTG